MDDESGPIEAKEVFDQGDEPSETTEATETGQTEDSVSTEESEDYSLISEDDNPSGDSQVVLEVDVVLRDDELMVFGDELAVQEFIDSLALPESRTAGIDGDLARIFDQRLKNSGTLIQGMAEISENSGRFVMLTKETLEGIKEFGLVDTDVPGIKHVMLGARGDIKKWAQMEVGIGSKLLNPAVLSGIGGMMTQLALQQSMAEITTYLKTIDHKLDEVIRKVDEAKKSDLSGLLKTLREAMIRYEIEGAVDSHFMNHITDFHTTVNAVEDYAWCQINATRGGLGKIRGLKPMMLATEEAQREISQWLGFLANAYLAECRLDDFKLKEKREESLEAYNEELKTLRVLQANRDRERATRVLDLYKTAHEVAKFADKKLLTNRAAAEALNQRANEMAELAYSFAEAVQLTVERKSIPIEELGMFANFASRSIQTQRDELPKAALNVAIIEGAKTLNTHGPKVVKLLKEFDWSKIR
ncbi:putative uncharacterized protein [Corynebacterium casei UCMA 3821]|uniref:Uncharacterized protein n=1 Tax=Corynebacterium casei UCMA 3821 TaxID=1110505 RepID=G7I090_9CORY|nr:hypothetical protein [Corynebacterium casei]CCE55855.1 putative uncharacterized protein [Corynebacterium casei UCMA 3821]